MSGARAAAPAAKDSDRGRVTLSKVSRYWAGKRPDGLDGAQDEQAGPSLFTGTEAGVKRTPVAAAVIVKMSDPRLARLANTDVGEAREGRHRCDWLVTTSAHWRAKRHGPWHGDRHQCRHCPMRYSACDLSSSFPMTAQACCDTACVLP